MFDKYVIVDGSLTNVAASDGGSSGYQLQLRIPYYRGLGLSMVDVYLTVDGVEVPRERVTFSVRDHSYRSDQMGEVYDERWGFTEPATITVDAPGGLEAGSHEVSARVALRVSYSLGSGATDTKTLQLAAV